MWYAIAVWFAMGEPIPMPVVNTPFKSKSECIEYVVKNSDFNTIVYEAPHIIVLDDGVKDMFAVACQTRTQET